VEEQKIGAAFGRLIGVKDVLDGLLLDLPFRRKCRQRRRRIRLCLQGSDDLIVGLLYDTLKRRGATGKIVVLTLTGYDFAIQQVFNKHGYGRPLQR